MISPMYRTMSSGLYFQTAYHDIFSACFISGPFVFYQQCSKDFQTVHICDDPLANAQKAETIRDNAILY